MQSYLVDLVSNKKLLVVEPKCKVGRDEINDIVINGDLAVSRFHFLIIRENNQYYIEDCQSRHGTFLNGNQVHKRELINDGDVLKVGISLFWFVVESSIEDEDDKVPPVDMNQTISSLVENKSDPDKTTESKEDIVAEPVKTFKSKVKESAIDDINSLPQEQVWKADDLLNVLSDSLGQELFQEPLVSNPVLEKTESAMAKTNSSQAGEVKLKSSIEIVTNKEEVIETKQESSSIGEITMEENLKNVEQKSSETSPESAQDLINSLNKDDDELTNLFKEEAEAKAKEEAEAKAKEEAEAKAKEEAQAKAKEEAQAKAKEEAQAKAKEEAQAKAKEEAQAKAKEEAQAKAKEEAEAKAKEEAEAKAKEEAEAKAKEEAEAKAKEEAEAKAKEEAQAKAKEEAEAKAKEEAQAKAKEEAQVVASSAQSAAKSESGLSKMEMPELINQNIEFKAFSVSGGQEDAIGSLKVDSYGVEKNMSTTQSANGKEELSTKGSSTEDSTVVDSYLSKELARLDKVLAEYLDQIKNINEKVTKVESRINLTKELRKSLLTDHNENLLVSCAKVLAMMGFDVKTQAGDRQELRLHSKENDDAVARVVWNPSKADRSDIGQLSMAQTKYWVESGNEPKGLLIVSKLLEDHNKVSNEELFSELTEYAVKRNVCLITSIQLLSMYKEVALGASNPENIKNKLLDTAGWLEGFEIITTPKLEATEAVRVEEAEHVAV